MSRRGWLTAGALLIAAVDLVPIALISKQAFSSESQNLHWPPVWWPQPVTFEHFRTVASGIELVSGGWLSVSVALMTVFASLALAFPAAWLAARRVSVDRTLDLTLFVARLFPILALAIPIAAMFVRLGIYNDRSGIGLWLAHTLLALPFAFFVLRNGLRDLPVQLEEAAQLDGASRWQAMRYVTIPLLRPSLAAAAMLTFLVSWDEIGFALLLQVTNRPLPALIYYYSAFGYPGIASAIALLMLLPAVAMVLVLIGSVRPGAIAGSGR